MSSYSDLDSAKAQLSLDDGLDNEADIALLAAIDEEVSGIIESKTGRVWGGSATPETRTIERRGCAKSEFLFLPSPIRSVSAVAISGGWSETLIAYDATTRLGNYVLWNVTRQGDAHALKRVDFGWWPYGPVYGKVAVTGVWSDTASGAAVPAEIAAAATFIAVETFRQRKSSPTGEVGPEGFTVRPRNPWNFQTVIEAIAKYAAAKPAVYF